MAELQTIDKPITREKPRTKPPVPWNVVLLDDDEHSYEYVIRMAQTLFGHPLEKAFTIAEAVDTQGRAVLLTTHKEHAELKRDQVRGFGRDPLMVESTGAMGVVIEPAEFEGNEGSNG